MKLRHLFYQNKRRGNKVLLCLFGLPVYIKKYDGHHAYYSLLGIRFLKKKKEIIQKKPEEELNLSRDICNVAIYFKGGLGDMLINANFVYLLRKKLADANMRVDVYCPKVAVLAVLKDKDIADNVYLTDNVPHNRYDLSMDLSRFPILRNVNKRRILFLCPELYEMVQMWEKDNVEKYRFIDDNPTLDGLLNKYYLIQGYKRWEQFDIEHILGMTENFPMPVFIDMPEKKYLKSLKLPTKFITIHRGVDSLVDASSVKQWPVEYYNDLIKRIRNKYPKIFIVQLGDSKDRCPEFEGVDLNLSGETSLEQLKVLLKHALLHIDGEGGMVHLRHALNGGKSIVLFGPTDPNVYGYSENINLVGKGCVGGCEWLRNNWQSACAMGVVQPFCQYSLKPETVFEHFVQIMGK